MKAGRRNYTLHVGADVGRSLDATKAHDQAHAAVRSEPESRQAAQPKIPAVAEFFLRLLLNKMDVEAVVGDLVEMYDQRCKSCGEWRAKLWFYGQIALSMWPLLKRVVSSKLLRRLIP
jgi:hypothetical protein